MTRSIKEFNKEIATKGYHRPVTEADIEEFFETRCKKMAACGIDPDTVVMVGGDETIC
jgi:hypothetical protein|nr:MAG TPA: diacylgycerol kinase [Caudoviricetes sp.]